MYFCRQILLVVVNSVNKSFIEKYEIEIGTFYFYKNFVVGEVDSGADLNFESGKELYDLLEIHFKNTIPYVYISNRINSYSFKPTRLYNVDKNFPNLKGYGIVIYDPTNKTIAQLEETFTDMPTQIFDNLEDAICWAKRITCSN